MVNEHQTNWDTFLDGALFAMRTKPQSSTKYSPFFLLYGREAKYPSQLPKDFGNDLQNDIPTGISEEAKDSYISTRQETTARISSTVAANIEKAQGKQKEDFRKRQQRGRKFKEISVGDQVLIHNTRKATSKQKSNLQPNYHGPYNVVNIDGKSATLKNSKGQVLKQKPSTDNLKLFVKDTIKTSDPVRSTGTSNTIERYMKDINADGSLQQLVAFVCKLQLSKPSLETMGYLLHHCPQQSFVKEMNNQGCDGDNELLESFGTAVIPYLRHLQVTLTEKTTVAMLVSAVCCRSAELFQPVMVIAETLKEKPCHLKDIPPGVPTSPLTERLSVGGETLEAVDLSTMDEGKWLNDKVINFFLALIKLRKNTPDSTEHVFILPSYTAVQWDQGHLQHWMFKKVRFSKFSYILLPICVNGNHWVLMVADIKQKTVHVLDSLHGDTGRRWTRLWMEFMAIRDSQVSDETFGVWNQGSVKSNKQMDSNSCGVFVLMNAECIVYNIPIQVMRQVHCRNYRSYVKASLLHAGTTKTKDKCDMPECTSGRGVQRLVKCCVCGRWMHKKCAKIAVKAAIEDDFECVLCQATYH